MAFTKPVANIIPGVMAVGVLGRSMDVAPRYWDEKGLKKHRKRYGKKMLGGFTDTMVGVPMIGATSNMVAAL